MPGGILNLIAYGNQNIIINGNPKKTFFKSVYMKHTNFGIQKFRLDYEGSRSLNPNEDTIYKFKVPRNAELLLDSYFCFTLPDIWSTILPPVKENDIWKPYHFKWIDNIGSSAIANVKISIGSQIIQEYPGEYIRCVAERDFSENKKKLFDEMTGNIQELTNPENYGGNRRSHYPNSFYSSATDGPEPSIRGRKIYIPLNPWFMNGTKVSLPLVSLQYSELIIEVTMKPLNELFTINNVVKDLDITDSSYKELNSSLYNRIAPNSSLEEHSIYRFLQPPPTIELNKEDYKSFSAVWETDVHLISNYCFLTKEESKVFALNEQKYLIKDVKYNIHYNLIGSHKLKIDTNALVSSWLWFFRRSDVNKRNEWSNYTNWETKEIPFQLISGGATTAVAYSYAGGDSNRGIGVDSTSDGILITNHRHTPTFSTAYNKEILQSVSIIIDGKYRENTLDSGVFSYLEPYRTSKTSRNINLYNYNFCIDTCDYIQPSGAINLSRFRKIELEIVIMEPKIDKSYNDIFTLCDGDGGVIGVSKDIGKYDYTYEMHFFEERYNILRFISGNAGLLFAR